MRTKKDLLEKFKKSELSLKAMSSIRGGDIPPPGGEEEEEGK